MDSRPDGVVPVTPEMGRDLVRRLAPEHVREVAEVSRLDPAAAVDLSLAVSREAYAVLSPGGEVLFLMGVEAAGSLTATALVWMLAAPEARRHPARLLRAARWGLERAFAITGAEALEQYIPEWYAVGLRFAERLGFVMRPAGGGGGTLWRITLERRDFLQKGHRNGSGNTQHPGGGGPVRGLAAERL